MKTSTHDRPKRSVSSWIILALGATWALALVLAALLFVLPQVIPDCTLGGKATSVQCGELTPVLGAGLELLFPVGMSPVILTPFWAIAALVVGYSETKRAST